MDSINDYFIGDSSDTGWNDSDAEYATLEDEDLDDYAEVDDGKAQKKRKKHRLLDMKDIAAIIQPIQSTAYNEPDVPAVAKEPQPLVSAERKIPFVEEKRYETVEKQITKVSTSEKKPTMQQLTDRILNACSFIRADSVLYVYQEPLYIPAEQNTVIASLKKQMTWQEKNDVSYKMYDDVYKNLQSEPVPEMSTASYRKQTILFNNGMFDILNDEMLEIGPEQFCRYKIDASYYPYVKFKTPVMDGIIASSCGKDRQIYDYFWSALAYLLLPECRGKKIIFFGTAKHSGKSCIGNFIERLYGDRFCSHADLRKTGSNFGYEALMGSAINTTMDISAEAFSNDAVANIKSLTGGDKVTMNIKYIRSFPYRSYAKLLLGGNHPIKLRNFDDAFWERLVIVPFQHSIPRSMQDPDLEAKLWHERDAIVGKAMLYGKQLVENNFEFPPCEISTRLRILWADNTDTVISQFIEECCVCGEGNEAMSVDLYIAYSDFCLAHELPMLDRDSFYIEFSHVPGLDRIRRVRDGHKLHGYKGIGIK